MTYYTSHVLMIRPVAFRGNEQTAVDNTFQKINTLIHQEEINRRAQKEFDALSSALLEHGIEPIVVEDTLVPDTPDSIFCCNTRSLDEQGRLIYYPMYAENRRLERQLDVREALLQHGFIIQEIIDFSNYEEHHLYLEGAGVIVLDRKNSVAYCSLSARVEKELLLKFCEQLGYEPYIFESFHIKKGVLTPIYHTNVMLTLSEQFAILCTESIVDIKQRQALITKLEQSHREVIPISIKQLNHFAGNMLQLQNQAGELVLIMSTQAYLSLNPSQIRKITSSSKIIHSNLSTIETYGGGSARCMLTEIFLPKKTEGQQIS